MIGAKLKKPMDEFYGYSPGTTKTIKSKPEELSNMVDINDNSARFSLGTTIYKIIFNDIEYKREVKWYNSNKKLYHIKYDDGDAEDYHLNKVYDYCAKNIKRYPRSKQ